MNEEEFKSFRDHPVRAYDPAYTRDGDNFLYQWESFIERLRTELVDALHLSNHRLVGDIHEVYYDTIRKIERFERATGQCLISYYDSQGRLRQNRSVIRDLYGAIHRGKYVYTVVPR